MTDLPPSLRRIAHLLLLDRSRECALLSTEGPVLTPPAVSLRPGQDFHQAVTEAARSWWGVEALPISPLIGHGWATALGSPSSLRSERRLLMTSLAHLPEPARSNLGEGPARSRWWPLAALRQYPGLTSPLDLHLIVEGYWDGWLPDGPLSLDWP